MIGMAFYPLSRVVTAILVFFTSIFSGAGFAAATGQAPPSLAPLPYPAWTHEHWVWENDGDEDSAKAFAQGFLDRDIPVGVLNIDRPWAKEVGDFTPHPQLYPHMDQLAGWCHENGMKLTLWTTCMVNEGAANFAYAKEKGYFLSDGKVQKWWAGNGAMLDYTNPEAVRWWHGEMDKAFALGIDGWKLDGADPYVMLLLPAYGKGGLVGWKQYQKLQYEDFYDFSKEKGKIVWTRPTDDVIGWGLPLTFAPREINFVGWVGDQDNDWGGLRAALNQMFTSSLFNYVSYGSDIGGFRSGPAKNPKDVFLRWAQLGAFTPIMENGGGGEHRPWMYDEPGQTDATDIYRDFVRLHYALIPYISSQVAYSYETHQPTMRPSSGVYQYMLGDSLLVAPFYQEGNERTIVFPQGDWLYLFDEARSYKMGVQTLTVPMEEFPVFIRKGAILPTQGLGDGFTTVKIYPAEGTQQFGLYEQDRKGTMLSYTKSGSGLTIQSGATQHPLLFRVYGEPAPQSVKLGGQALAAAASLDALQAMDAAGYFADAQGILWIAVPDATAGAELTVAY